MSAGERDSPQLASESVFGEPRKDAVKIVDEPDNQISQPPHGLLFAPRVILLHEPMADGHQDDLELSLLHHLLRPVDESVSDRIGLFNEEIQLNEVEDDAPQVLHPDEKRHFRPAITDGFLDRRLHESVAVPVVDDAAGFEEDAGDGRLARQPASSPSATFVAWPFGVFAHPASSAMSSHFSDSRSIRGVASTSFRDKESSDLFVVLEANPDLPVADVEGLADSLHLWRGRTAST